MARRARVVEGLDVRPIAPSTIHPKSLKHVTETGPRGGRTVVWIIAVTHKANMKIAWIQFNEENSFSGSVIRNTVSIPLQPPSAHLPYSSGPLFTLGTERQFPQGMVRTSQLIRTHKSTKRGLQRIAICLRH